MKIISSSVVVAAATVFGVVGVNAAKPHVLLILVDDFGFNNLGVHRARQSNMTGNDVEVDTPNLDGLIQAGIELDRHYTYNFCSPTRSSLQSGRLPVNVVVDNIDPLSYNPDDPERGVSGMPVHMTGLAERLKEAGYKTAMTGKWDVGMAHYKQTPMGRGYDKFFGYYHHANDYYNQKLTGGSTVHLDICAKRGYELVDLWDTEGPARKKNGTEWEEYMFTQHSLDIINNHDTSKPENPLFLFHSFHIVHTPLQVPENNKFSFLYNEDRRKYATMVSYMDKAVGQMVAALEAKGMWENTLLILSSDNGGPIYGSVVSPTGPVRAFGAANNLPLRGGKTSDWEGGIRVNAFVSGGAVPVNMRGTILDKYIHVSDWYATLVQGMAGLDPTDKLAEEKGLPPIDSINQWDLLMGNTDEPQRTNIHISRKTYIEGRYKLLTGSDGAIFKFVPEPYMSFDTHAVGYGPVAIKNSATRGRDCSKGCLFDIFADPNEDNQITDRPEVVAHMMAKLEELNKSNFNPDRGHQSAFGCEMAMKQYNGFYGPFLGLPEDENTVTAEIQHPKFQLTSEEKTHFQAAEVLLGLALFRS